MNSNLAFVVLRDGLPALSTLLLIGGLVAKNSAARRKQQQTQAENTPSGRNELLYGA